MSALPPKVDVGYGDPHVRFVPKADMSNRSKTIPYSIAPRSRAVLIVSVGRLLSDFLNITLR
jgi:hypothetical protein